jgi:CHAT domain-containing protein
MIARPVLDTLGFTETPGDSWPRIWWIPTGPLAKFPIHAAGSGDSSVLDRVISSYSASVQALVQSHQRRSKRKVLSEEGKAVLVGMERTPDHKHLPYVPQEIEMLSRLCGSTKLQVTRPQTHRSHSLSALQNCRIFHFAGHGLMDQDDPSKSSLILSDGLLAVESLFELNLHNHTPFLAYLSACGTGEVKQDSLIDEALHLISACQLAGFQHVIGTLWKVKDQTCVKAAAKTYDWMIKGNMSDDSMAEGLHRASQYLRAQWVSESAARTVARASERMAAVYNKDSPPMTEQAWSNQGTARDP